MSTCRFNRLLHQSILIAIGLAQTWQSNAAVVTYPAPAGLLPSDRIAVTADGQPVFVYNLVEVVVFKNAQPPHANIASFALDGTVQINVVVTGGFTTVAVRPKHLGIAPTLSGDTIQFSLSGTAHLSIELDGDTKSPLLLFADAPETNVPSPGDPNVLFFEGGQMHELSEHTLDQVTGKTVYLAGGAVVNGALILNDCSNIVVRGPGVLHNVSGPALSAYNCDSITIDGPILLNEADTSVLRFGRVRNSHIVNSKVIATKRSGIVLANSRRTLVDSTFVCALENAVSLKGDDLYGFTDSLSCDTVRSCVIWSAGRGSGLEIGRTMTTQGAYGCLFRDIDIIHVEQSDAAYDTYFSTGAIAIHDGGPRDSFGPVENTRYESIRIEDCRAKYLFDLGVPTMTPVNTFATPGQRHIRGIYFKNITVTGGPFRGSNMAGFNDTHLVEDITFEGLVVLGQPILNAADLSLDVNTYVTGVTFISSGGAQTVPTAPVALTVSLASRSGAAMLQWTDDATYESAYIVEQALAVDGPYSRVINLPANSDECEVDGLQNGSFYAFRVYACNDAGCSDYSNVATLVTDSGAPAPGDYAMRWRFDGNGDDDLGGRRTA